jgi:archaeosine synthase
MLSYRIKISTKNFLVIEGPWWGMELITAESLNRPEVKRWHRRILERYTPPEGTAFTVFLPCSAKKPYSSSRSHRIFHEYIKKGAGKGYGHLQEVILTSPLGLVPRELEGVYPAAHYDVPVTGHWTGEERDMVGRLMEDYMKKAACPALAHVDGALREVCSDRGIPLTPEGCLSDGSLTALRQAVRDALKDLPPKKRNPLKGLRKVADFQFGTGAGDLLFPQGTGIRRYRIFYEGKQTASIHPRDGLLSLTLKGAELLRPHNRYTVEVSFKPTSSSILAPGVEGADPEIRPGDDVLVIYKGEIAGVGRALLSGGEMVRARRGLAVAMRHRT